MKIDQVQKFEIGSECMERMPCGHKCTITLDNDIKKTVTMDGDEIFALIKALPLSKVAFEANEDFSVYDNMNTMRQIRPNYSQPIPADILSKIFNN